MVDNGRQSKFKLMFMSTKRPRTTISFDPDEYNQLQDWAKSEFRTVPQLISAIVKKALIEKNQNKTN
ncbi:MAG: ribbon-helix-helix domain-containing protein [Cuspidothrix sp.]